MNSTKVIISLQRKPKLFVPVKIIDRRVALTLGEQVVDKLVGHRLRIENREVVLQGIFAQGGARRSGPLVVDGVEVEYVAEHGPKRVVDAALG
jgi:hypothetical protein